MTQRLTWVDAIKGFLMILVVIGHYPGEMDHPILTYIYWFHMPAFFLLSGLFFRPVSKNQTIGKSIKKRMLQLMIPYVFFVSLITILRYILAFATGNDSLDYYLNDFYSIVIGGRFARGCYAVIWFITTLVTVYVLFMLMTHYLKRWLQITVLISFYILAQLESHYVIDIVGGAADAASQAIFVPWNLDVALMAIVYFAIGYYARDLLKHIPLALYVISLGIVLWAMRAVWIGALDYHVSMKFIHYNHPVLDIVIPIACIIVLLGTFQFITKFIRLRVLEVVERHSLIIMYAHISFDKIFNNFFDYGIVGYTLVSFIPSILISWLFMRFMPYASFFTGNLRANRPAYFKKRLFIV